jgi:hypothetical protein
LVEHGIEVVDALDRFARTHSTRVEGHQVEAVADGLGQRRRRAAQVLHRGHAGTSRIDDQRADARVGIPRRGAHDGEVERALGNRPVDAGGDRHREGGALEPAPAPLPRQ